MNLSDATLLLTRPREDAERFKALCEDRLGGAGRCILSPLLEMSPVGRLPDTAGRTPIFTSQNGVRAFVQAGGRAKGPAYVVGPRTHEVAQESGFDAKEIGPDVRAMIAYFKGQTTGLDLIHITGVHHRGELFENLEAMGQKAERVVLYDQKPRPLSPKAMQALATDRLVVAPIFSPRTAKLLRAQLPDRPKTLAVCALSAAVADAWGNPATIAREPNASSMIDAIAALLEAR